VVIEPFMVSIDEAVLVDLRERLARTRWPDEIDGSDWSYGTSLSYLQGLITYWLRDFDWRAQERAINAFAHFQADIDGSRIHYIHERGRGPRPLPLFITHGWPSSFLEMLPIIRPLSDPASFGGDLADAFDVVVPSLPGYGFSDRPTRPGMMAPSRVADVWARLADMLGYARFGSHGGDLGGAVSDQLGLRFPERMIGLHFTTSLAWPALDPRPDDLSEREAAYLTRDERWLREDGAYIHLQATRPQTLAFGLTDSPVGLAAWVVEKFRAWSDCGGDLDSRFSRDDLLTNLTLYWATSTMASSMRMYFEHRQAPPSQMEHGAHIDVPVGVARPPAEMHPPREFAERTYTNIQRWTELPRGGHFVAMEEPELLVEEIRAFFRPLRSPTR
jgi:pimeloyl-ACP methyl ester carboxylesterase